MSDLIYTNFLKNGSVITLVSDNSGYVVSEINKYGNKKVLEVLSKYWHNKDSAKEVAMRSASQIEFDYLKDQEEK
jgi:hypothetical protein